MSLEKEDMVSVLEWQQKLEEKLLRVEEPEEELGLVLK
tara:strand:- start:340 stop:453 length:114 start_codon:yes stop_codon:yes gene_type:complete